MGQVNEENSIVGTDGTGQRGGQLVSQGLMGQVKEVEQLVSQGLMGQVKEEDS